MKYKSSQDDLTQTAMHMAMGLQYAIEDQHVEAVANKLGGWIGLVAELEPYSRVAETMLEEHDENEFDGVYAYDVAQAFGHWFGELCVRDSRLPTEEEARVELTRLTDTFIKPLEPKPAKPEPRARIVSSQLSDDSTVYAARVKLDTHAGSVDFDAEDFEHAHRIVSAIESGSVHVALRD